MSPSAKKLALENRLMAPASPSPEYVDPTEDHDQDDFLRKSVVERRASTLKTVYEHQHTHLHHDANAKKDGEDEVVFSQVASLDAASDPHHNMQDNVDQEKFANHPHGPLDVIDPEKGSSNSESNRPSHKLSAFHAKYRAFFHLFICLLFTGFASFPSSQTCSNSSITFLEISRWLEGQLTT